MKILLEWESTTMSFHNRILQNLVANESVCGDDCYHDFLNFSFVPHWRSNVQGNYQAQQRTQYRSPLSWEDHGTALMHMYHLFVHSKLLVNLACSATSNIIKILQLFMMIKITNVFFGTVDPSILSAERHLKFYIYSTRSFEPHCRRRRN